MSAETPATDIDALAIALHTTENPGSTPGFSCGECRRTARIVLASDWLAAYVARRVEAVESERDEAVAAAECNHLAKIEWFERAETAERERDEARAGCDAWVRNTVSADGRYYRLRDAVLGADTCPAHEFVPVAGHPDDDECTDRWDETDATYCGRPRADHEHEWDAEAVARAKQARAVVERMLADCDEERVEWRHEAQPNPHARRGYRRRDARILTLLDALEVAERERDEAQAEASDVGHDYDRRGERLWRLAALAGWTPGNASDNDATAEAYVTDALTQSRAVIERVTALNGEAPADAFWKASVAGTVERDRGGYYGRGFRDGYGRAQADLRAALTPATEPASDRPLTDAEEA